MEPGIYLSGPMHEAPLGLLVAAYLFFTSVSEGLVLLTAFGLWFHDDKFSPHLPLGISIALVMGMIGALPLMIDLAQPLRFINLYKTFVITSPPSWGALILPVYMGFLSALGWLLLRRYIVQSKTQDPLLMLIAGLPFISKEVLPVKKVTELAKWSAIPASFAAMAMMTYTGMIIGVPFGSTLWPSLSLPLLYACSAVATGSVLYLWGIKQYSSRIKASGELVAPLVSKILIFALLGECVIMLLSILNVFAYPDRQVTLLHMIFTAHKVPFLAETFLGIVLPIVILYKVKEPTTGIYGFCASLVLAGSLVTRISLVSGLTFVSVTGREFMEFQIDSFELIVSMILATMIVMLSYLLLSKLYPNNSSIDSSTHIQM